MLVVEAKTWFPLAEVTVHSVEARASGAFLLVYSTSFMEGLFYISQSFMSPWRRKTLVPI